MWAFAGQARQGINDPPPTKPTPSTAPPTRASKHKQVMERSEPTAANDTRKEGPRTD